MAHPSQAPARAAGRRNLRRSEAMWRSGVARLRSWEVVIDLTGAPEPECDFFDIRSELQLDLLTGARGLWVDFIGELVREVSVDGEPVPVDWDGARVALPELGAGTHTVAVDARATFSTSGQGLNRFHDPVDGRTYLYTHFEPADARRAWPCLDQPDLKAPFTLTVVHPADWTVLSNGAVAAVEDSDFLEAAAVTRFEATPPLPSYLTALAAGPWHRVTGSWTSRLRPQDPPVDLSWSCRASLAEHLDDEPMAITAAGMDLFDAAYGFAYPWGPYDSVLVPEYSLGAMENPGLVTFDEATYLFRGPVTRADRAERANTILHEMCHMWFGNLVTPRWWEDTWLKESFADHQGTWAQAEATDYPQAWVSFASTRKAWAYAEDCRPSTTHPIVAEVEDVEAASQAFDGIAYAKGAAVLKQLVAHVGQDVFQAAARDWFATHAFGNGDLSGFLRTLSAASGRDMTAWADAWLGTSGASIISNDVTIEEGRITSLTVTQSCTDPVTGREVTRPHSLVVGLYSMNGAGELVRTHRLPVELDGGRTAVPGAVGLPAPDLVTLNDEDHTYALLRPDAESLARALANLGALTDPMARSLWWSTLANLTDDGLLAPADFVAAVLGQAGDSTETATLTTLLRQALRAATRLSRPDQRAQLLAVLTGTGDGAGEDCTDAWSLLVGARAGSDAQLVRARAWIEAAGQGLLLGAPARAQCATRLRELGRGGLAGLTSDDDLRWRILIALARLGSATPEEFDRQRRADPSATGMTRHLQAVSSCPGARVKAEVFNRLLTDTTLSKDHMEALAEGFSVDAHREFTAPHTSAYLAALEGLWSSRSQENATRLVRGLFPAAGDERDLQAVNAWLTEHPHAPAALTRLVLKGRDDLARALRARCAPHRGACGQ